MTEARYRELLSAAPEITSEDVQRIAQMTLKLNPLVEAVRVAIYAPEAVFTGRAP